MLTTIIGFIIVLGILVFFHELGHYWVARRNGIVVEEFGMGYPPRLIKLFTYDGTDFTLNALPLGGFARMKGEDAGDMSPGSFNAASRGGRAATLLAGPIMNALLAILLFAGSFMAGFPAPAAFPLLGDVAADSVAASYGLQTGDLVLEIDGSPALVRGMADMNYRVMERDDAETPSTGTLVVSRANEVLSLPFDGAVSGADLLAGISFLPVLTTEIIAAAAESPAELSGMEA
jgi:regulator of sigma E protease